MFPICDELVDLENMAVGNAASLVFVPDDFSQRFEVIQGDLAELRPFHFGFKTRLQFPLSGMPYRSH